LILLGASPSTSWYAFFMGVTPKLYSNCFLALLNARIEVTNGRMDALDEAITTSALAEASFSRYSTNLIRAQDALRTDFIVEISQASDMSQSLVALSQGANHTKGVSHDADNSDKST
ncbi:hypothetical protein EIP91_011213, partial [Steccherinum ochraceum]